MHRIKILARILCDSSEKKNTCKLCQLFMNEIISILGRKKLNLFLFLTTELAILKKTNNIIKFETYPSCT